MTDHEKRLVKLAEQCAHVDEVRHDQTRQRQFEQSMLSLDWKNEKGDVLDYGDCSRHAKRLFRKLDRKYISHVMKCRWEATLDSLKTRPKLKKTLLTIREVVSMDLHRSEYREKIILALKIEDETYRRRFCDLTKIVKSRLDI